MRPWVIRSSSKSQRQAGAGSVLLLSVIFVTGMTIFVFSGYKSVVQSSRSISATQEETIHQLAHEAAFREALDFLNYNAMQGGDPNTPLIIEGSFRPPECRENYYGTPTPSCTSVLVTQDGARWQSDDSLWTKYGRNIDTGTTQNNLFSNLTVPPRFIILRPWSFGCDPIKHTYTYIIYTRVESASKCTFGRRLLEKTFSPIRADYTLYESTTNSTGVAWTSNPSSLTASFTVSSTTVTDPSTSNTSFKSVYQSIIRELWVGRSGTVPWAANVVITLQRGTSYSCPLKEGNIPSGGSSTPCTSQDGAIVLFKAGGPATWQSNMYEGMARGNLAAPFYVKQGDVITVQLFSPTDNGGRWSCQRGTGWEGRPCTIRMHIASTPAWCDTW